MKVYIVKCAFLSVILSAALGEDVRLLDLEPADAQQLIDQQDTSLKYAPKIDSNVPAVRYLGQEPHQVLEDIYLANQYHGQDGLGGYLYGYSVPDIAKTERKKPSGDLKGAYNYIAGNGKEIKVEYWDDGTGFHQIDNVDRTLPQQIDDTPEVKAAKDKFARIWQEEAERNSHPIANPYDNAGQYASGPLSPQGQLQRQQQFAQQGVPQGNYPGGYVKAQNLNQGGFYNKPQGNQGFTGRANAYNQQPYQGQPTQNVNQYQAKPAQDVNDVYSGQQSVSTNTYVQNKPAGPTQNYQQPQNKPQSQSYQQAQSLQQAQSYPQAQNYQQAQASQQSQSYQAKSTQQSLAYQQGQGYRQGQGYQQGQQGDNDDGEYHADDEGRYNPEEDGVTGPPKGFFYKFDYPVGIIVSKDGQPVQHGEGSLKNIYEENKAQYEAQLKGQAAGQGGAYIAHQQ